MGVQGEGCERGCGRNIAGTVPGKDGFVPPVSRTDAPSPPRRPTRCSSGLSDSRANKDVSNVKCRGMMRAWTRKWRAKSTRTRRVSWAISSTSSQCNCTGTLDASSEFSGDTPENRLQVDLPQVESSVGLSKKLCRIDDSSNLRPEVTETSIFQLNSAGHGSQETQTRRRLGMSLGSRRCSLRESWLRRWVAEFLIVSLVLLPVHSPGALASLEVSVPPPVDSPTYPSPSGFKTLFPSSSPLPRPSYPSSLASHLPLSLPPTLRPRAAASTDASSSSPGPPPPPWEDDPCGGAGTSSSPGAAVPIAAARETSAGGAPWLRAEVSHDLFETESLVPGVTYKVSIEWSPDVEMRRLAVTSRVSGVPGGFFSASAPGGISRRSRPSSPPPPGLQLCTGAAVVGLEALIGRSSYVLNWTLPAAGSDVTLRISYLPVVPWEPLITEAATTASDLSIGVVTQSLRLLSACELALSRSWGTFSWRDIEHALAAFGGGDCTVHFPSPPSSPPQPPPPMTSSSIDLLEPMGLLVDLTRLNVACSQGHLQFGPSARHIYCGKLEEYKPADRQVHIRGLEKPFLRVHSRNRVSGGIPGRGRKPFAPRLSPSSPYSPVHLPRIQVSFSLRYRPVEPCYNVTLTDRNGTLLIPPPPSSFPSLPPPFRPQFERVRCTLTVHLPYGYRMKLKLMLIGGMIGTARQHPGTSVSSIGEAETEREDEEQLSRWSDAEEVKKRMVVEKTKRDETGACSSGVLVGAWEDGPRWTKCVVPNIITEELSEGNKLILRVFWGGAEEEPPEQNELSSEEEDQVSFPQSLLVEYAAVKVDAIVGDCSFGWLSLGRRSIAVEEVGRWALDRRKRRVEVGAGGLGRSGGHPRRSTCVGAIEGEPLPWASAEAECVRLGGHLASIRNAEEQAVMDLLLTKSPGYTEHNSYWVGASDVVREGDFRWTDGADFSFSNWFPGWASHGHYNRQPNDDGLSGQDCVELRRAYHLPSAPPPPPPSSSASAHRPRLAKSASFSRASQPQSWSPQQPEAGGGVVPPHRLSETYAWNDRDCSAVNFFVCEREETPTRSNPATVADPSAAGGGGSGGDGGPTLDGEGGGSGRHGSTEGLGGGGPGPSRGGSGRRRDCNREIRLGDVREAGVRPSSADGGGRRGGRGGNGAAPGEGEGKEEAAAEAAVLLAGAAMTSATVTSPNFPAPYPDNVHCETVVKAPRGYRLLLEFEELVLEDEPSCTYDYLEILDGPGGKDEGHSGGRAGTPEYEGSHPGAAEEGRGGEEDDEEDLEDALGDAWGSAGGSVGPGRRLCGDWSSRLKLLRHVTSGRSLTLRFVSDYSHRFGGFRATVSMQSAASIECADKRLQPFNNSCYLFVGYPEVTWLTAQQICHEMKAELASVLSPSEYQFVTSSIRGSDQYSNSAIYWLGGKTEDQRSGGNGVGLEKRGGEGKESGGEVGVGEGGEETAERGRQGSGWHWVDGSPMVFQAWLPDSSSAPAGVAEGSGGGGPLCLGVRWRQSPSPRLHASGLHWSPEACSSVGGYVCKRRKSFEWGPKETPPPPREQAKDADAPKQAGVDPVMSDCDSYSPTSSSPPASSATSNGGDQEYWSPRLVVKELSEESGVITSPGFPDGYPPEVCVRYTIKGPPKARLFIRFTELDLEDQPDCLYDYVEVREVSESGGPVRAQRWCGSHSTDLERFDFVSDVNTAQVTFRSDYSVSGKGFSAMWRAVDVSGCPSQTLTASSGAAGESNGVLTSPNHPTALIPRLNCTTTLLAPAGRHVWLEFSESEVFEGGGVELWLGAAGRRPFRPFVPTAASHPRDDTTNAITDSSSSPSLMPHRSLALRHLGDGVFLSAGDRLMVRLWTGDKPRGKGFKATFRAVDSSNSDEHVIILGNNTKGPLLHLNYPDEPPPGMHFVQRLLAPHGHVVRIRLLDVAVASSGDGSAILSATPNGTSTTSSPAPGEMPSSEACKDPPHLEVRDRYSGRGGGSMWLLCHSPGSVLSLTSYLNSITVVQRYVPKAGKGESPRLNAMVKVETDPNYKMKILSSSKYVARAKENRDEKGFALSSYSESKIPIVESCYPNPCLHGGKCIGGPGMRSRRTCQCKGYYTGLFCALTVCDLEPCVFGHCVLSPDAERGGPGFTCNCFPGYTGITCDERPKPCADNPCEGRGDCLEKGPHSFVCRCHAWWEGQRCEKRMLRIPYKPLSERMLHEPFWLGLITVTVVLGIIGLIWCAKRHFPEKLEKLLAEEADRTRHGVPASSSARDNLQSLGGAQGYGIAVEGSHHHHHQAHPGGQQPPHPPRSLFGRLGIRKPSLLSLTGGSGTSAQMQRPQLAQPTQSPPGPNTPAVPNRKPNAPMIPYRQASSSHLLGSGGSHQPSSSSSSAARTFSLDDLLKLPPRRSPSSRKKRNNSSPTRKHSATPSGAAAAAAAVMAEAEKKKILQSLVSSAPKPPITSAARLSISLPPSETLSLGECPPNSQSNSGNMSETKFMGEGGGGASSGDDIVMEEPLPGPPLMPPVPPTASRLDKKVTFARLLSRVSAEMGSSSASASGSESAPAPKPVPETPAPSQDSLCAQHPSSPASDESSSVSSSTSSSSFQASITGTSPAVPRKSNRNKIQVTVVDAMMSNKEGISSTRGPSIFLEPPSSCMGIGEHPPLSPIHEIPSPSPSPTRVGLHQLSKDENAPKAAPNNQMVGRMGGEKNRGGDKGETDDVEDEEDEEEEEPARVCVTQSPEEEGGGGDGGGGGEGGENEEEEDDEGDDDEGDEDDDEDDDESEEDEEDQEDEEEQERKAEDEHVHQKQKELFVDAAALEATDDDIGDEGLEEDSPEGMDTMSEETHSSGNCSVPKSAPPTSTLSPPPPLVIPMITVQQPSPTRTTVPNNRPLMMLPIGSPPPRRRLSEHHSYPPPIFFQPPLSPQVSQPSNKRLLLHGPDKPNSLDLPICPPVITVTATMSESDETEDCCADGSGGRSNSSTYRSSGNNTLGPSGRRLGDDNSKCGGQTGMTYLSPFSMCSRGERTASESNLSSSGYSSMASPGPSRAGSNNPLCPSDATDAEDPHQHPGSHPHHGPHLLLPHHRTGQFLHPHLGVGAGQGTTTTVLHPSIQNHHQHFLNLPPGGVGGNGPSSPTCSDHDGSGTPHLSVPSCYSWTRRPSPLLQTPNMEDAGVVERPPGSPPLVKSLSVSLRKSQASSGSNCETVEFGRNSGGEEEEVEGVGEAGEGRAWRRRRMERHNSSTTPDSNDEGIGTEGETGKSTSTTQKTLQLPSIVVGVRGASPPPAETEPGSTSKLSPVSSRSESPLSDRVSLPSSSPFGHNSSPRPFSSLFFGKGPPLPLTDSDALYDCPSSEVLGGDDSSTGGQASQSKGLSIGFGLQSPHSITSTGKASNLLEVPHRGMQRKVSPKRRVRAPVPICSSSSSSSSLEGIHSKRPSTSTSYVQLSSKCSSSSDRAGTKSIEVPYPANLQSPTKLHHYQPRKYKHLRGWISPGATDQKKCFEVTLSPHGLPNVPYSSNPSSSSTATTPLPNDDANMTADAEIIGKESKWIYGPEKIGLHEALMLPLDGQHSLPQARKICRMKTIGHQIRFLRRLELTLKKRERLASPSDSDDGPQVMDEEDDCDRKEDSSQSSSETTKVPLLPMMPPRNSTEGRYRSSLRRHRRSYDRASRIGGKSTAPVLEPLLHQIPISSSSEDEGEKSIRRSSPFRQRHTNIPTTLPTSATVSVAATLNANR